MLLDFVFRVTFVGGFYSICFFGGEIVLLIFINVLCFYEICVFMFICECQG